MKNPIHLIPLFTENEIELFPEQDLKEKKLVTYDDLTIIFKIWFKEVILKNNEEFEFLLIIKAISKLSNWKKGLNAFLWKIQIHFEMTIPEIHLKNK